MSTRLQRFAFRWLARAETVRVADCVHFCAFRYGCGELNPYEEYAVALAKGEAPEAVRGRFVAFLCSYRPVNLGEALGVTLAGGHGLWEFPWARKRQARGPGRPGWCDEPAAVPDVLTHFSERGIPRKLVEQEFRWLESALRSIREHGYQPGRFSGHPQARKLVAADGTARYLMYDGNHRLSVLAALGEKEVRVRIVPLMTVRETELGRWPLVAAGVYSPDGARRVFRAYFDGNLRRETSGPAAEVVDA